jgi:hypothetical protein
MSTEHQQEGFQVGGRYRNHTGEYEVLRIDNGSLIVQYDNGHEAALNARMQTRIIGNMNRQNRRVEPYSGTEGQLKNERYYRSMGFLAVRVTMLEAIVHPIAEVGFETTYRGITGQSPSNALGGYSVHAASVDKWANELRVTFAATYEEMSELDPGPEINIRENPGREDSWRINKNAFWWSLLRMGFKMGREQNLDQILANVPRAYVDEFNAGVAAGS